MNPKTIEKSSIRAKRLWWILDLDNYSLKWESNLISHRYGLRSCLNILQCFALILKKMDLGWKFNLHDRGHLLLVPRIRYKDIAAWIPSHENLIPGQHDVLHHFGIHGDEQTPAPIRPSHMLLSWRHESLFSFERRDWCFHDALALPSNVKRLHRRCRGDVRMYAQSTHRSCHKRKIKSFCFDFFFLLRKCGHFF